MTTGGHSDQSRQYGFRITPGFILTLSAVFLGFLILVGVLTRVLPQGEYERRLVDGYESIVDGTYRELLDQEPLSVWKWFTAPVEVMFVKSDAVLFATIPLMFISGVFYVVDKSNILKRFLGFLYNRLSHRKYFLLVVLTSAFLLLGSVIGIVDEVIALVPMMILLAISFGWDSLVGVGICYLAVNKGYAASTLNPYGTALAQSIAGVPLYSGLWLRVVFLLLSGGMLIVYLYFYAKRIDRDHHASLTYDTDENWRIQYTGQALFEYERRKYPFRMIVADFFTGVLKMVPTILIFCLILGMQYLIEEGKILDTIIYNLANLIRNASSFGAAMIICLFVMIVEVAIPGTIMKALAIIPIVAPLGEFSGISRQATCLIFAIGDSFPNLLYPTDPTLILALAMIGTTYKKWIKWLGPYVLYTAILSIGTIAFALSVGY